MRYLTNHLEWINDGFVSRTWYDHEGNALPERFSFGGSHDWQAVSGTDNLFCSDPYSLEMAKAWLSRDKFASLVTGHDQWTDFLSELLDLPVEKHLREEDDPKFVIKRGDVVLRVGHARIDQALDSKWSSRYIEQLPGPELIALLKEEPDLIRFHLHYLLEFNPATAIRWDAGL